MKERRQEILVKFLKTIPIKRVKNDRLIYILIYEDCIFILI